MILKCDMCGKEIIPGNDLPGGARLVFTDGKKIDVCTECISKGCNDTEYLEKFLERWEKENGD